MEAALVLLVVLALVQGVALAALCVRLPSIFASVVEMRRRIRVQDRRIETLDEALSGLMEAAGLETTDKKGKGPEPLSLNGDAGRLIRPSKP